MLICVRCHGPLTRSLSDRLTCGNCAATFNRGPYGYFEMVQQAVPDAGTAEDYAACQHHCSHAVLGFLRPLLEQEPCRTVLDVGCGVGGSISELGKAGYDAFAVDLPEQAPLWAAAGNDPNRFFVASALNLPFQDNSFDFVFSLGVVEHIGTILGHCALASDYQLKRQQYAKELLRVTKPGGRILIACPNKSFPIDIQHGPGDAAQRPRWIRSFIFNRTGMNVHKTWGAYHLVSYAELKMMFTRNGVREFTAISSRGYFQFGRFRRGFLKPFAKLAEHWVNNLPALARTTFLNPYVMAQIRK